MGRYVDDFFQHDAGPQPFADHEGRIIGQVVRGADMQVSEGLFQPDSQPVCLIVILQDLIGYDEFFIPQVLRGDFFFLRERVIAAQEEAPAVDSWAGEDFVFIHIDVAIDDSHVDEALVEEFHHLLTIAAGDMEMQVGIPGLDVMGGVHEEADAVRFGRADADGPVQFGVVAAQFLFRMTGQGEDFFSPLFQE